MRSKKKKNGAIHLLVYLVVALLLGAAAWVNLIGIMLNKRTQNKREHSS